MAERTQTEKGPSGNERTEAGSNKISWGDRDEPNEDDDAEMCKGGTKGRKYLKGKVVIDATGDEEVLVVSDEPEGFKLDGAAEGVKKQDDQCPRRQHRFTMEEGVTSFEWTTMRHGRFKR